MEKIAIKKSRIVIAAVFITVFFCFFLYNFGAFQAYLVNKCEGANARTNGVLSSQQDYRQYFRPKSSELAFVEVRLATYTEADAKGSIRFALLDANNEVLTTSSVDIKDLQDDEYYRFPVNLSLEPDASYSYTLRTEGNEYEKSPTVWVASVSDSEETRLSIPGSMTSSFYQTQAKFGYLYTNTNAIATCVILVLLTGFVIAMPFRIKEKHRPLFGRLALVISPLAMFFIVEALNDNSAMQKITPAYFLNYLAYILIYLILFAVTNQLRVSVIVSNTVLYILAVINYFKLLFRGEPLQPWDLFSAGTAMNVAENYTFYISSILMITILSFLLLNISMLHIDFSMKRIRTRVLTGALSLALSALMVVSLFGTDRYAVAAFSIMQKMGIVNNVWNQPSNYAKNGFVLALTMNAQYMNVDKPEGYSAEAVQAIKEEIEASVSVMTVADPAVTPAPSYYPGLIYEDAAAAFAEATASEATTKVTAEEGVATESTATAVEAGEDGVAIPDVTDSESDWVEGVQPGNIDATVPVATPTPAAKPNIIAIMCESFADLRTVGNLETNIEVMPFIDTLEKDAIKGSAYVSTYGGGTANSEFEFLTGNPMAFLPNGSVPYQQYIEESTGSLACILKKQGYSAIAVHPFTGSGWNRPSVYEAFGFDDFLSDEDFINPIMLRQYISDESSYDKLIELYEAKPEGQPIFLFNVTMQNHGGYVPRNDNFEGEIKITSPAGDFSDVEEYLSLAHESDEQLKELVDYFSRVDEPTVIVFFGDHLPKLKNSFYDTLLGKDLTTLSPEEMVKLYQTPFVVWANYDIPEQEIEAMSLNYLSSLVLKTAGLPMPDYNYFLNDLFTAFPVISPLTVMSADGTIYPNVSAAADPSGLLKEYAILCYNNLFDKTDRDATIFDSICLSAQAKQTGSTIPSETAAGQTSESEQTSVQGKVSEYTGGDPDS